jgi:two-component system response regulator RegA
MMVSSQGAVLVVDDDPRTLAALSRSLGHHRTVFATSTLEEASRIARRERPTVAIVDLRIGDASGLALLRSLKAEHPDMTLALMSGYLSTDVTVEAVKAGADVVMAKPLSGRDILKRLDRGPPEDVERGATPTLEQVESEHIARVLTDTNNNISEAARRLGIFRSSLQRRLKRKPKV